MTLSRKHFSSLLTPIILLAIAVATVAIPAAAQDPQRPDTYESNAPGQPTGPESAERSKTSSADHLIAQKIQKAIASDDGLSALAHKIQVTVHSGKVTLQGKVASLPERNKVMSKATNIAGAGNVVNRMKVSTTAE